MINEIINNIIFLDIDGVLNSALYDKKIDDFIPEAISILNELYINYNAKIVISSSWRISLSLDELKNLFKRNYCIGEIIDITEIVNEEHYLKIEKATVECTSEDDFYMLIDENSGRNYEILQYVHKHNIKRYVIFDDMIFSNKELQKHFIRTNNEYGLVYECIENIEDCFNGENTCLQIGKEFYDKIHITKDEYDKRQEKYLNKNKSI